MIDIRYKVMSATQEEFTVTGNVAGTERQVKVPGVSIEMVSEDGSMGHTFRFVPDGDVADVLKAFKPGRTVDVELVPVITKKKES